MNSAPSPSLPSLGLDPCEAALAAGRRTPRKARTARTLAISRAESLCKTGNAMIIAGFVITILGVVLYCAVSFAGSLGADLAAAHFRNTETLVRATLGVLGVGTLVWLAGSITYLQGAMASDHDETASTSR